MIVETRYALIRGSGDHQITLASVLIPPGEKSLGFIQRLEAFRAICKGCPTAKIVRREVNDTEITLEDVR